MFFTPVVTGGGFAFATFFSYLINASCLIFAASALDFNVFANFFCAASTFSWISFCEAMFLASPVSPPSASCFACRASAFLAWMLSAISVKTFAMLSPFLALVV